MKVRNKIGFHCGPGGNATGIGEWMKRLDRAGIPFFLKSVDGYGPLFEASEIAKKSGIEHTLIFRLSTVGQGHEYDYDVPPYKDPQFVDDPEGAAIKHWRKTVAKLPPEFDKERTWIEPINEVDKNLCDWLGNFAVKIADLAKKGGYKVSLFAWSSGEPEKSGWETPGMLAYLRLCAQRPQQAAIALHEYSYLVDDIKDGFPFKIGRFQTLFEVCDRHRIPWPTVHMTEWGWTLNNVPSPQQAIADIKEIGNLYARYPQISGAAIWYLGPGFGSIANKAQKLIKPVLDFTLLNQFEVPIFQPAVDKLPDPGDANEPDLGPLGEPQNEHLGPHDESEGPPNEHEGPHDESEGPQNELNGSISDGEPGDASTADDSSPDVAEDLEIPIPVDDWDDHPHELIDPPNSAGSENEIDAVETDAQEGSDTGTDPLSPQAKAYDLRFVADVTIPDDSRVKCRSKFSKTWRVRNAGSTAWDEQIRLVHTNGTAMTTDTVQSCPPAAPGEDVEITIHFTVPDKPGVYFSDWHLQERGGNSFGEVLFTRILADDTGRSDAMYIADITIPDDSRLTGGSSFTKTWRVRNTGARVWGGGFTLQFEKGSQMGAADNVPLPAISPGEEGELSIPQTAPLSSGTYFGDWRLTDDKGRPFGEVLFLRIVVP